MMSTKQTGDHTIEICVDAHVVTVSSIDPNVIAYLKRIARNCGIKQMISEARANGITVTEGQLN